VADRFEFVVNPRAIKSAGGNVNGDDEKKM